VGVVTTGFPAIASLHPAGEVCAPRVPPQIAWTVAREREGERGRETDTTDRRPGGIIIAKYAVLLLRPFFFCACLQL
jgi:hypothetical protein